MGGSRAAEVGSACAAQVTVVTRACSECAGRRDGRSCSVRLHLSALSMALFSRVLKVTSVPPTTVAWQSCSFSETLQCRKQQFSDGRNIFLFIKAIRGSGLRSFS